MLSNIRTKVTRIVDNVKFRVEPAHGASEEAFFYPLFVTTNIKNTEWKSGSNLE